MQLKFKFRLAWPTFTGVITLCSNFVSGLFSAVYRDIQLKFCIWIAFDSIQIKIELRHAWPSFTWVNSHTKIRPFWSTVVGVMPLENLFGLVGDLYCFSNTFRMLVMKYFFTWNTYRVDDRILYDGLDAFLSETMRDGLRVMGSLDICASSLANAVENIILHATISEVYVELFKSFIK